MSQAEEKLLEVKHLKKYFKTPGRNASRRR